MTLFVGEDLLPHLRANYKYEEPFTAESKHLAEFLGLYALGPAGRWVTLEELARCAQYRELDGVFFDPSRVFFEALKNEPAALVQKTDLQGFELPEHREIRQAFSRDRVLSKYIRKVEGWRIAIERKQLPEVKKRQRTLGFFAE